MIEYTKVRNFTQKVC